MLLKNKKTGLAEATRLVQLYLGEPKVNEVEF